jgi:hypothetical protein
MLRLQFFYGLLYVSYLVRLGHLAVFLNVDSWISGPGCLEDVMASSDARFSEVPAAQDNQIVEQDIFRFGQDVSLYGLIDSACAITCQENNPSEASILPFETTGKDGRFRR